MSNALAWIVATFVTMPILALYFIYLISIKTTKNKKRSLKLAVDYSTILFIIAVYFIVYEIWTKSFFWIIMIVILIIGMIFTIIHWKVSEDIQLGKLLIGIWRVNFLLFFFAYLLLSLYGLFISVYYVI